MSVGFGNAARFRWRRLRQPGSPAIHLAPRRPVGLWRSRRSRMLSFVVDATEPRLEGRVCLVTGANTGIGRVTALELARRGAQVIVACRSEAKAREAIEAIVAATGNEAVEFLALDLGSLAS